MISPFLLKKFLNHWLLKWFLIVKKQATFQNFNLFSKFIYTDDKIHVCYSLISHYTFFKVYSIEQILIFKIVGWQILYLFLKIQFFLNLNATVWIYILKEICKQKWDLLKFIILWKFEKSVVRSGFLLISVTQLRFLLGDHVKWEPYNIPKHMGELFYNYFDSNKSFKLNTNERIL